VLEQLMNIYPRDERFFPKIIEEFGLLQQEMDQKVVALTSPFPNSILASYIRSDRAPRINPNSSPEERQEFIRYNYLNNIDFSDTLLLSTDIFPNKSLSFIMLFRSQRLDREQQAEEFIKATDLLLPLAMIEPQVYNYLLEYTISGFEQIGMESVLMHIAENYPVDESCKSDHDSGELQRRIEGYRKLASGKPAPLFKTTDINDQAFELAAVNAQHTLIVFWASWCPHCTSMMPQIRDMATRLNAGLSGQTQKLSVVSVSIDHAEKDYLDYLTKNNLNSQAISEFWVNINDYKAWDGPVPDAYYLYATPTMVLLDKDKNIISKPSTMDELTRFFNR
jgi:peroxiredoxin